MANKKDFANVGPVKPDVPTNVFDKSHTNNLTMRPGRATPIMCDLVPPRTSGTIKPYVALDMHPTAFPLQTNVRLHTAFYKVPLRILFKDYKDMWGQHAADGSIATPQTQIQVPHVKRFGTSWFKTGSLADYLGIPSTVVTEEDNEVTLPPVPLRGEYTYISTYLSRILSLNNDQNGSWSVLVPDTTGLQTVHYSHRLFGPIERISSNVLKFRVVSTNPTLENATSAERRVYLNLFYKHQNLFNAIEFEGDNYVSVDFVFERQQSGYYYYDASITLPENVYSLLYERGQQFKNTYITIGHETITSVFGTSIPLYNNAAVTTLDGTFKDAEGEIALSAVPAGDGRATILSQTYKSSQPVYRTPSDWHFSFHEENGVTKEPLIPLSVLPFRAYEFIKNFFFNNERITPFTIDGRPVFNKFITTDESGWDDKTPLDFFNVPFEYDLFTTCVKTPQFGNAPLVGITSNDDESANLIMRVSASEDGQNPSTYNIGVRIDPVTNRIISIDNYESLSQQSSAAVRLQEAIQYGISINDLRSVSALQRFQERHLRAGTKIQNIIYEFFGVSPDLGEEFPEFLGGCTQMLNTSKVVSTATTEGASLGEFKGQGAINGVGQEIHYSTQEDCYIIGISYISVTPCYSQMLPAHWTKSKLLDFYNPQFANLGLQPVYKHQLAPLQLTKDKIGDVFGYNRPYADYVSMQDEVHGDFRESMSDFLLQRIFGSAPDLGADFIYINSEDLTDVWQDMDDNDKFFGQFYFDYRCKLPIPRFAVPRII